MTDVTLRPVRFTDHVARVREVLTTLGLAPRVESERGGWVDLVAGSGGMVALHDAATSATRQPGGRTVFSAECDDATVLADRLHEAGYDDATVHDEAYGRVLTVTDPDGRQLQVDQRTDDLHGYRESDTSAADPRWRVRAALVTPDVDRYRGFLDALGLADLVDLHAGDRTTTPAVGPDGAAREALACELVLVTAQPLDEVAGRLRAAGLADAAEGDDDTVTVTDPDGARLVIRAGQVAARG